MRAPLPFSHAPWVDRLCADALDRVAPLLQLRLVPYGLRGIVLGGSASLGEAVGWEDPADRFVLSDLDLGVVTDLPVPDAQRNALMEEARASVDPAGPEPTLGFYESRFLGSQAPTLGLVDLRERGRVVAGEQDLARRFAGPAPREIPTWEALRLLGNRALELLRAPLSEEDTRDRARAWFAAAKLGTAPWTARLVSQGRYRIGWRARVALLHDTDPHEEMDPSPKPIELSHERMDPSDERIGLSTGRVELGRSEGERGRRGDHAVIATARLWAPFLERPCADTAPARERVLPSLRAGLVGFFQEAGYWPDVPEAASRSGVAFPGKPEAASRSGMAYPGKPEADRGPSRTADSGRSRRSSSSPRGADGRGWVRCPAW